VNCLVVAPHSHGIREVARRVGAQWETMGHDVRYRLPDLPNEHPARVGGVTIGIPGIAAWWYRTLRRLARTGDCYDLIWTHQPITPLLPTDDADFWRRVVVTFHTTEQYRYQLARDGVYSAVLRPYYRLTKAVEASFYRRLQRLDGPGPSYTVVARQLRDEIASLGIDEAAYVPNGVFTPDRDHEAFAPIRAEYGIPDEATLVFNIGSLTPMKRPALLARTMGEVIERDESVYCVIAGDGSLFDDVSEHAQASERVRAIGRVSEAEKWRWFADADLFVSLSAYEGMPVATLEALSFGLPVVLSDVPAHRQVLAEGETTGETVRTPRDVLAAIGRLRGRRAHVSLPRWDDVAESYLRTVPDRTTG
jgi:glycosyltransferase involved in cell wall biosynthesis